MTHDPVLSVAIRAARRAAAVIDDAARDLKRLPSHAREHAEVVGNAAVEAENAIIASLRAAFPDHAIIGRESGEIVSRIGAEAEARGAIRWIVDPLAGLANFAHGYPHYAISVALVHGSATTHAVVLDPLRDELFTAIRGNGAQVNERPIRTSMCTSLGDALVGTAFPPVDSARYGDYRSMLSALETKCAGVRRTGAAALDLAFVAMGRLDGFFTAGGRPWDAMAGALVVAEAGGRVGNLAGGHDIYRANELVAAAAGLFQPLREALAAVPR